MSSHPGRQQKTAVRIPLPPPRRVESHFPKPTQAIENTAWRNPDACWEQAEFGLRLGAKPQTVITTTPKPTKLIKMLANSESTHITQGTTYENRSNLAPTFLERIMTKYEGTTHSISPELDHVDNWLARF